MGKGRKNGGTGRRENGGTGRRENGTEVSTAQQPTHFIVHTKGSFTHAVHV